MSQKKLLLVLILFGTVIWNIPNTYSIFQGQHSFYVNSSPCQKCHQDIQIILDQNNTVTNHTIFGCQDCHTHDGNSSHAAKIVYCTDCHSIDMHMTNYTNCNECHISHGGQNESIPHGNDYACDTCHIKV